MLVAHMTVHGMQQNSQSQFGPHGMSMQGLGPGFWILMGFTFSVAVAAVGWCWHILARSLGT